MYEARGERLKQYKTYQKVLVCVLPVLALGVLYVVPQMVLHTLPLPGCVTYILFHINCPGCGLTRSVYALVNGDILMSLRQNIFVIAGIVLGAVYYLEFALAFFGKQFRIKLLHSVKFWYIIIAVLVVYTVARNIIPAIAPIEIF